MFVNDTMLNLLEYPFHHSDLEKTIKSNRLHKGMRYHLCYLLFASLFARLGLDHLVGVVIWWDAHRSEAGRRNPLGKGDNKDIAGVQPRSEQRADEVGIM